MPSKPLNKQYLKIEISEATLDRIERAVAIQAVGRASAGFLSNPGAAVLIVGTLLGISGFIVGKKGAETITDFFAKLQALQNTEPGSAEQSQAANAFISAQRALIEFFAPVLKGFLP